MLDQGADLQFVDLNRGLTGEQLNELIGRRDYREFLNTRNALYREMGMKTNPPPRDEALRLMSENPNLIRRPLIKKGRKIIVGFNAADWSA